ncbi:heat shock 70 kDa protein-like isoform X2 [Sitophilus oryzae]|uniref:Heat shock 70 kDa protein-like isoform X2 n=1 Tax=Sitophilus oryzae TaxID=7048 RepID=A0A6J2XZN8_SITOR|nr:heat shock 70 kDa protein-like isoform X2 [Sitophilus oryzae]
MATEAPVIGIDLGTSFSSAAVYQNGKVEVIPTKEGHKLVSSHVFYHPKNLEVSVGTTADHLGIEYINNFIYDAKRVIGRKFDDVYVQKLKNRSEYKFNIVRGEDDKAEYRLKHDALTVHKSPEQVSSEILKYLRESASEYLGAEVTEAVISVPAHFSNAQRAATKAAAELAGLKVLKLISEPVAGAVYYMKEKHDIEGTLLVFDMGGGTSDVSIIKASKEKFEVLSVEGDTFLGGRDYDNVLLDYFITKITELFGQRYVTPRLTRSLKEKCVVLKEKLSTQNEHSLILDCIRNVNDDFHISLTRNEYDQLTNALTARALNLVQKCLAGVGLSKGDINEVILVGGMTRMPKIREDLRIFFGDKDPKTDANPDEAVALGAAIQASVLKHNFKELEKYIVAEVTPLSLGIKVSWGLMCVAIEKNTPLPAKGCLRICTLGNDQKSIQSVIFEGERKNCAFNTLLGEITIDNLPKGKAEVEKRETSTNQKKKLTVTLENYRLCQKKISDIIEDAEKNRDDDILFEKYKGTYGRVWRVYDNILYDIKQISSETDRSYVEKKCGELKISLNNSVHTEIDKLIQAYKSFRMTTEGIVNQAIHIKWPNFS